MAHALSLVKLAVCCQYAIQIPQENRLLLPEAATSVDQ